jgi:hypothetical protein
MYSTPPLLARVLVTTNAAPATLNSNVPLIATPGAGKALRIASIFVATDYANTGTGNLKVQSSGASGVNRWSFGWTACETLPSPGIPPPGWQLPENEGLECSNIAQNALQSVYVTVLYFIDDV